MRTLGLDIGERRIGVAVSDPSGTVATPLVVLDARGLARDATPLRRLVEDYEPALLVVGMPLTMAGEEGPQASIVKATVRRLIEPLGIPVAYHDERLSSTAANRAMAEAGADEKARRGSVDMVAASLLLQSYLDANHRNGAPRMSDDRPTDLPEGAAVAAGPEPEPEVTAPWESGIVTGPEHESGEAVPRPPRSARRTGNAAARDARSASPQRAARIRTPLPSSAAAVRRRLVVAFSLLGIIVLAGAFGVWSTLYRATASVPAGRAVTVTIAKGASGDQVASQLASAGVVANPTMFRLRATMLGATGKLKPGTYTLATGSSYEGVIAALTRGPLIEYITVTIPEGWGIDKIAARMQEKLGIPAAEFVKLATTGAKQFDFAFLADDPTPTLQGYLFPKTYDFKKGAKAADVIRIMLTQYGVETADLDYSYARSKGLTPHDVLTIASIIEREAQVASDRPKVASVICNRLAMGMKLQLDSTVQYALNGKAKLDLNDLKTDNPYNTYFYKGLPPGPICNPGMSAITAAAQPAKTDYIYYILTHKDGSQSFTSSYSTFLKLKNQLATKGLQ